MTDHDPRNIQMGQWALQRGWLSREQCRSFLEEATSQGRSIAELALRRRVLSGQQAQTLIQHSGWSDSANSALITPKQDSGPQRTSGSKQDSGNPRTPTSSLRSTTQRLPEIGEDVEGYKIVSLLGKGGMGAVYKARSANGSEFALKFILQGSEKSMARFEREAQAVAAVDTHPNIVSIHKLSRHGSYSYIVLDYVEGQSMDNILKDKETENADKTLIWVGKIAAALKIVHSRGITHRDIKPANILIRKDSGEPLLTDFGLAKMDDGQQLTHSREVLGTPHYMAPEQAGTEKDRIGPGSDIWALGVILYQACTGQL
ncbi:MAG: serine/threonine-protein kinase, partial [Planctomycetota bacterium]|nr:serine/threonine-protein kinase [Planctomycetota bacterium]